MKKKKETTNCIDKKTGLAKNRVISMWKWVEPASDCTENHLNCRTKKYKTASQPPWLWPHPSYYIYSIGWIFKSFQSSYTNTVACSAVQSFKFQSP
jgi:hypothetical protein